MPIEMQGLIDLNFDIELLGFSTTEIDFIIDGEQRSSIDDKTDAIEPVVSGPAVSRAGDLGNLVRIDCCAVMPAPGTMLAVCVPVGLRICSSPIRPIMSRFQAM